MIEPGWLMSIAWPIITECFWTNIHSRSLRGMVEALETSTNYLHKSADAIQYFQFDEFLFKSKHICSMPPPAGASASSSAGAGAYSVHQHHLPPEVNIEVPSDSDSSRRPSKASFGSFSCSSPATGSNSGSIQVNFHPMSVWAFRELVNGNARESYTVLRTRPSDITKALSSPSVSQRYPLRILTELISSKLLKEL